MGKLIFVQSLNKANPEPSNIKFDDFFRSERMLNFLGMSNLPRETPLNRSRERRALFQLSMIITIIFFGLKVASFMYGLTHGGSLLVLMENVSVTSIESTILIKVLTIMYWRRETLFDIILKLKQQFPDNAWNQHVFHVPQHLKTLNINGTICASLYKIVLVQFSSMPIFIKLYGLMSSQETKWELIFQNALPLDTSAPLVYIILSIIDIWSIVGSSLIVLIPDLLFNELIAVINLELAILAQLMSEIDPSEGQDEACNGLKKLSENHQKLIDISETLKDILSPLVFIDCFGMMISVCCNIFLTLSAKSTFYLLKYSLITIVSSWNAFNHCYYGDRLNEASLSIAEGAYNCNWLCGNTKFRKMLLIVMVRSRKVQELTGMGFVNINLETFKWMMQTSYSYYSILSVIYKS